MPRSFSTVSSSSHPTLTFTLSAPAILQLSDAILCMQKFHDEISLEARREGLTFSLINSSKSVYVAVHLSANAFFLAYTFVPASDTDRWSAVIQTRALLQVFRPRGPQYVIEKLVVTLQEGAGPACRIEAKLHAKGGVVMGHKWTYEDGGHVQHALFDRKMAKNFWRLSARQLKSYMEHFSPRAENLAISSSKGRAAFTSFTEKLIDGKEILKQPLQTSVAWDVTDFDEFHVEQGEEAELEPHEQEELGREKDIETYVAIILKDMKAIAAHADQLDADIEARFSYAARPMQICYGKEGLEVEFVLMTMRDPRAAKAAVEAGMAAGMPVLKQQSMFGQRGTGQQPVQSQRLQMGTQSQRAHSQSQSQRSNVGVSMGSSRHHHEGQHEQDEDNLYSLPNPRPPRPPPLPPQQSQAQERERERARTRTPFAGLEQPPPSPPLPANRNDSAALFLNYGLSDSSDEEESALAKSLDHSGGVSWNPTAHTNSNATGLSTRAPNAEGGDMYDSSSEYDEDDGVGPTQHSNIPRGLFD